MLFLGCQILRLVIICFEKASSFPINHIIFCKKINKTSPCIPSSSISEFACIGAISSSFGCKAFGLLIVVSSRAVSSCILVGSVCVTLKNKWKTICKTSISNQKMKYFYMMPLRPLNFAQCFHDLLFHLYFRQYDPYFHLYFQLRQLGFKKFE